MHEFICVYICPLFYSGGATPTLKILSKGAPFFTGCMEDVVVDGKILIPSQVPEPMKVSSQLPSSLLGNYIKSTAFYRQKIYNSAAVLTVA